ncbi:MAG: Flagellar motor switch protein FliN [Chlamydiae bacterium]|nr:Flagellar motor switch protein FliN [Chlamydiota bacterium]
MAESYDWIKRIDASIATLEEKPQFGAPLPFPWEKIQEGLRTLFEKSDLALTHKERGWTKADQLWEGFGEKLLTLSVVFAPLSSPIYWVMGEEDLKTLLTALVGGEEMAAPFCDSDHVEGFHHYLALEVLEKVDHLKFAEDLSPALGECPKDFREKLGDSYCFAVDVSLTLGGRGVWGHLIIPSAFREEWKSYFASKPKPPLSEEAQKKLIVDVALEAGSSELSWEEWKGAKVGDFVILDSCFIDPDTKKGRVVLTLGGEPLFRGKFEEDGIKLLEYPFYEEVKESMDEEFESEASYNSIDEKEEAGEPQGKTPTISPEKIPVSLTVEVGRVRMTAEELMQLAPGNLVQLPVSPDQGVDLVVNGKKLGKGELVKVGEVLGVRILQL